MKADAVEWDDPPLPRVAPGEYTAIYQGHQVRRMYKGGYKLVVDLRLLEHPGIVLQRWYNLQPSNRIACARAGALVR